MGTKKKRAHFSIKLAADGQMRFLEALGDDGPSLVLTVYSNPKVDRLHVDPTIIQSSTIRFDAVAVDQLIACLATILGYEIVTDLKILTEEAFEGKCRRAYIRNPNAVCPVSVELWNLERSIRLYFDGLNFHREEFGAVLSMDSARNLLEEIGPLYGWKLQG